MPTSLFSRHRDPRPTISDYVIIGAGAAGCVLAARLSEDPTVSVLLLEAGGSSAPLASRVPAAFPTLFRSRHDWAYDTEPGPGSAGRPVFWPRGRALGGSTALNAMVHVRGNPLDFDTWAAQGAPGWSWAEVMPAFQRSEDWSGEASPLRGTGGPLRIEHLRSPSPLTARGVAACIEVGITENPDPNGECQEGVSWSQVTQRRGRRVSAADAFLRPVLHRPNLTVRTGVTVRRVLIDGGSAVGVELGGPGREIVRAAREVLVSAGAIGSPQILMLSGIGPADHLREHGIDPLVHLSGVGANLQDHPTAVHITTVRGEASLRTATSPRQVLDYLVRRRGMLTSNVAEANAFVRVHADSPAPDLQLVLAPVAYLDHGFIAPTADALTIAAVGLQPRSRGRVLLRHGDPAASPVIDPAYLSDPEGRDLATLVAGLRLARRVAAAPALADVAASELVPGATATQDTDLAQSVRENLFGLYHPVGTCAMGSGEDSVVDPTLRVHGVGGLRVIDASVMPTITRGNTAAPTMMIAERASDIIKSGTRAVTAHVRG